MGNSNSGHFKATYGSTPITETTTVAELTKIIPGNITVGELLVGTPGASAGKSSHDGHFKLSWTGVASDGTKSSGTYTYSGNSTGDSYGDAHDSTSQNAHNYITEYLKQNVTNKYSKVDYKIEHTSTK